MKKKTFGSLLALTMVFSSMTQFASAEEAEPLAGSSSNPTKASQTAKLNDKEIKQAEKVFNMMGIKKDVQAKLIEKIGRGELLDSSNPAMKGTGKTTLSEGVDNNGVSYWQRKTVYPDGSVTMQSESGGTSKEIKPLTKPSIGPNSITGGTSTTGSGYVAYENRLVSYWSGFTASSFRVDYTVVNGGNDYIDRVHSWDISAVGSVSGVSLQVERERENGSKKPAYAQLRFVVDKIISSTFYHQVFVGKDKAWDTANW
ncbi:hypothetical protein [Thermoactinomyces sp. DSM 45892]|uniref:hypothetical protein n=1 Tax=Thermoactinomyces sp. DSM 45892 TaxID=1882753 RepID=UPI000898BEAB|nr:hypothetical protein [Thermoactinomyces sp. DSM 45892]SDZ25109.1 hypothetical protein SAMN05444416_11782 [Thermoactinomyces sp. DSM 45892]